jgi:hypothetical protein
VYVEAKYKAAWVPGFFSFYTTALTDRRNMASPLVPPHSEERTALLLAGTAGLGSTCSPKRRKIQQMKSITCFLKFLMVHFCESAFSMVSKLARANFQIYMYMYIKKKNIYMQCDY